MSTLLKLKKINLKYQTGKENISVLNKIDLNIKKKETVSVDGVNGPEIILGSLTDVSTNGNWPTIFDARKE